MVNMAPEAPMGSPPNKPPASQLLIDPELSSDDSDVEEDTQFEVPCLTCLGRIGRNTDARCVKQKGQRASRCQHCAGSNHPCRPIPAQALDSVKGFLRARTGVQRQEVSIKEFKKVYKKTRKAVREAKEQREEEAGGLDIDAMDDSALLREILRSMLRMERTMTTARPASGARR